MISGATETTTAATAAGLITSNLHPGRLPPSASEISRYRRCCRGRSPRGGAGGECPSWWGSRSGESGSGHPQDGQFRGPGDRRTVISGFSAFAVGAEPQYVGSQDTAYGVQGRSSWQGAAPEAREEVFCGRREPPPCRGDASNKDMVIFMRIP